MYILLTFHKLGKLLFEPLFWVAFAGVLLALCRNWKRRDWRFFLLTGGMIFMLLWRSGIALMSKRYVEIMVFPGLAFAAYFIYKFPICLYIWCRPRLPGASSRWHQRCRRCSQLLLGLILVIFLLKLCRYNRFDGAIIQGCAAIQQDRLAYAQSRIYEHGLGESRFKYYTQSEVVELPEASSLASVVRESPKFFRDNIEVIYLCCKEKKTASPESELGKAAAQIKCQRIFSSPLNNRKKYYLNIYRLKRN